MSRIEELFGSMVFGDAAMAERLPETVYKALKRTRSQGSALDRNIADTVAAAMKDWAMERGATHYSHWFQPMTGITAEKHEAFLSPSGNGGAIADFSGKELIKGEPDASSFPSGGLRVTFEARGYTAWDPTSYAFIKDDTLCIPTVFCSYNGQVLDKKTPLLRSNEALNTQALRVLKLLNPEKDVHRVFTTAGAEQEYFLIDRALWEKRPDLKYTGRTLFGARPPRGQELSDQYSGALRTRVSRYMRDLDEELWKLGIYAKTEHNEAAPSQHELAPVFTEVNIACDHNQLTMELMKKVAERHGFVCLLHEKPFRGVNGSGKHNNWSLCTDTGENLLDPGPDPSSNTRFLLFLCAVIRAVDLNQDLLRISTATAGNDNRLGGAEAPPAILSMFIGEDLCAVLDAAEHHESFDSGKPYMETGLGILPRFRKDTSDRNRTSPFAFTGNKFEFRMPGSAYSVADPNVILNTIAADTLKYFADEMEKASDAAAMARRLIRHTVREHRQVLFNGNNYAPEWAVEAEKRGLLNLGSAAEAISHLTDEKNVELFARHGIFSREELVSRREIMLETYSKTIRIEALTALDMIRRDILPAVSAFSGHLTDVALKKRQLNIGCAYEVQTAGELSSLEADMAQTAQKLDLLLDSVPRTCAAQERALYYRREILSAMDALRACADKAEVLVGTEAWPYPGYGQLLFSED